MSKTDLTTELVRLERGDGVATITLNRPEALNALVREMWLGLDAILTDLASDESTTVVILTGAGRAFSAGLDINAIREGAQANHEEMLRVVNGLERLPQATIGAINGYCFTGALELVMACDILLAAESAKVGDTHAKFGMAPSLGGPQRLSARIGAGAAKELLFSSRHYTAAECAALGLVNRVYPDETFMDAVRGLAGEMAQNSRYSIATQKRMVATTAQHGLGVGLQVVDSFQPPSGPDMAERLASFKKS
ncbi:MAG: Enoyl-CoA hydratase/carnithine racemase [Chloroflexi bacterium]|nr:MAG: Enoyl-CoA hydratase/carnithine racemase [Chloroflexota bacterium]